MGVKREIALLPLANGLFSDWRRIFGSVARKCSGAGHFYLRTMPETSGGPKELPAKSGTAWAALRSVC